MSSSVLSIASASKWIYGAYAVERLGGVLSASDVKFLTFESGYTSFLPACGSATTVDECLNVGNNDVYTAATDGHFDYGSGHMQKQASLLGLGALDDAGLAQEVQSKIGNFGFLYSQPQLAVGVLASADQYGAFLRKILAGGLHIASELGTHAVCTNPQTCATAIYTPVPSNESWHYSLGHWVEDDPVVGDGAFSSAGAFGFYPWIDASKTYYGIVARESIALDSNDGYSSAQCGRLIRKAWLSAKPQ